VGPLRALDGAVYGAFKRKTLRTAGSIGDRLPWSNDGQAQHRVEEHLRAEVVERRPEDRGSEDDEGDCVEQLAALVDEVRPLDGETWGDKLRRAGRAVRHAFEPLSDHRREPEPPAADPDRREA